MTGDRNINPPIAQKIPVTLTTAGHERVDNYFWLNERKNPKVIEYLDIENAYTKKMMRDTEDLQDILFTEITSRIKQDDQSVPYFKNGYFYYSRYEKGGEHLLHCRRKGSMEAPEEVMLNGNSMASKYTYFDFGNYVVSPNNRILAYCVDTVGRRTYTTMFKDLQTGQSMGSVICGTTESLAWADDNKTLFYNLQNAETLRSEKLMAHTFDCSSPDRIVYHEKDEAYGLKVYRSKSDRMILVEAYSNTSNEFRFIDTINFTEDPRLVQPREIGLEYRLMHYRKKFYIVTNYNAKNFRLMETSIEKTLKENWKEVIEHRNDVLLEDIAIFDDFMVVSERKNGLNQLCIHSDTGEKHYIEFDEDDYTVRIAHNQALNSSLLYFSYSSLTTPQSIFAYNMSTREKTLLKQQEIVGGYNSEEYVTKRLYAPASDGKQIPISLVHRKDTEIDGYKPLLLYGYGSYGININPSFSLSRISLLNRGFVYAIAHIRGGQTLGREWYEDGKLMNKRNTFTDFITCAEYLIAQKYTDVKHLCAMGSSAGGLLMGVVANMRPDLFKSIIAVTPFVDIVTTMNNKTLPLTNGEYDEWGNPDIKAYYEYMISYSPYDNVTSQAYPNMLVTAGFQDSQVQFWEPAKWVAKLRNLKKDDNLLLLYTNMNSGHDGTSGRIEQYRETALEYAFLLCKMIE